ncbi:MAG TPA: hypothetical protein VL985_07160 [Stellaceae bacterium]|nr:hypothetical protein [Stellaceae bacterium]
MPLDGSELFRSPALAKLWEVECLLATEDQWCKGRLHDRRGRHCLVGAITEANGRQDLTRPIMRAIKELGGRHYWRIESFNDDPNTNHQDVLRVLHRARLIIISDITRAEEPKSWYARILELMDELFPFSLGQSQTYGADPADPVRVRIRIDDPARPGASAPPLAPVRETVDMFQ